MIPIILVVIVIMNVKVVRVETDHQITAKRIAMIVIMRGIKNNICRGRDQLGVGKSEIMVMMSLGMVEEVLLLIGILMGGVAMGGIIGGGMTGIGKIML